MKSSDKSNSFEEVSPLFLIAKKFSVYTNSNFLFPISLQPDSVNLWYYKLRLFDLTECIVWNNWDLFIQLQGYRDWKIRVCGKDSIPLQKPFRIKIKITILLTHH